ncbi:MAG: hypothetical protein ACLPTZ_01875 [Beijerinckiaceae bacterium]
MAVFGELNLDPMLDENQVMDARILRLTHPGCVDGFIARRSVEVPDTFVPSATGFASAHEGYLPYLANAAGIFGIKPRWRWFGGVRKNLFETYSLDCRWFSVRGYACALPIYKRLWAIEREFTMFGEIKTHDVLALEATPLLFADPKIAKAVAQLCHPSPRKEAECLRWIPITT